MKGISPEAEHPVPNILIVDDTPANLKLLAGMLKKHGYRVRPVPSGKLAIQAVQNEKPDLILLDIRMPEMNGYEVCTQLKADAAFKNIPILFISALAEMADKMQAFAVGGVDYITKPFQFEEVEVRVATHLELRRLQIELEVQNDEFQHARNKTEALLEKYTDLYDFAPVGHCSLDETGQILELNLTAATLLGIDRATLNNGSIFPCMTMAHQKVFQRFMDQIFAEPKKRDCEILLTREDKTTFWASVQGAETLAANGQSRWCRVAITDITSLRQAEEDRRLAEVLVVANRELQQEIVQREAAAKILRKSEQHLARLLAKSNLMKQQLKRLTHRILHAQEDERKRISRELHDEITQSLVGISVHLEALAGDACVNPKELKKQILRTQRLVVKAVNSVHQFARELRPTMLDDLGLLPALNSFLKIFMKKTGIRVSLTSFSELEALSNAKRTVIYRVAHEALTNVAKHAEAITVDVSIQRLPKAILMQIKDNGKSFDVEQALNPKKNKRLGLIGMRERVEMVNGQFTIESTPGKGTTIQAQIPFVERTKEYNR